MPGQRRLLGSSNDLECSKADGVDSPHWLRGTQFIPCMAPRICIGWSTTQIPTANSRRLSTPKVMPWRSRRPLSESKRDPIACVEGQQQSHVQEEDLKTWQPVDNRPATREGPLGHSENRPAQVGGKPLCTWYHGGVARQEVKAVMRQPHPESQGTIEYEKRVATDRPLIASLPHCRLRTAAAPTINRGKTIRAVT